MIRKIFILFLISLQLGVGLAASTQSGQAHPTSFFPPLVSTNSHPNLDAMLLSGLKSANQPGAGGVRPYQNITENISAISSSTGRWTGALSLSGAPFERAMHSAIWTGSEMIIWGGMDSSRSFVRGGARYNPKTDTWAALPDPPIVARSGYTVVWTGSEMIVWGGLYNNVPEGDGASYNPATNSWTYIPADYQNAPAARSRHSAIWTGKEMIIWGGYGYIDYPKTGYLGDGAAYNPVSHLWVTILSGSDHEPYPRAGHIALWTGTEMLVWGGRDQNGVFADGARYNPSTKTWADMRYDPFHSVSARTDFTAIWTGQEMIIWGGFLDSPPFDGDGASYNPTTDSWHYINAGARNEPCPRADHSAVWTGSEMIIWGGQQKSDGSPFLGDGARYNPKTDTWTALPSSGAPSARLWHSAVWTGKEMIVWGGESESDYQKDGARYDPLDAIYLPLIMR